MFQRGVLGIKKKMACMLELQSINQFLFDGKPVTRGSSISGQWQVSWLTALCFAAFPFPVAGVLLQGSAIAAYSDEFAQASHLFPFSPEKLTLSRHRCLLLQTSYHNPRDCQLRRLKSAA
jgi:hypothetical protein